MNMVGSMIRRGRIALLGLVAFGAGLTGCVSQGEYDNAADSSRALQAELQQALAERDAARDEIDRLARASDGDREALRSQVQGLQRQLSEYSDLEARISEVDQNIAGIGLSAVDPATDRALRQFASRYPGMITYDAAAGVVRFASDVTFDSGSVVVKPAARNSIAQLAEILGGVGAGYDVEVVGHTDSQRPSNPRTVQRHPTNRHLSVHRAIAVTEVLTDSGVPSNRVKVAGWGEYRPAVPNTSSGNTPANRRVELLLVPSSAGAAIPVSGSGAPGGGGTQPAQPRTARDDFPIK